MRPIKFRAWHKGAKEMLLEDNLGDVFLWLRQKQPIEIMQFTGLKDKTGKEIFEWDIVKSVENIEDNKIETDIGQIEYWRYQFCLTSEKSSVPLAYCLGSRITLEVIGNIYENPELLK